jgi:hypothetical protein
MVSQNGVLRIIFGPEEGGSDGRLEKWHNEELHNMYTTPDIIRVIRSRRVKWAGHVARMG